MNKLSVKINNNRIVECDMFCVLLHSPIILCSRGNFVFTHSGFSISNIISFLQHEKRISHLMMEEENRNQGQSDL